MDKDKLFQEVVRLMAGRLAQEMEEMEDPVAFLDQRKTELMASLLKIDYAYVRTQEGRSTMYVREKYRQNMPALEALFRRNGLIGFKSQENISHREDGDNVFTGDSNPELIHDSECGSS